MVLNRILKSIYSKMHTRLGRKLRHTHKEVTDYIARFHEPENDVERSYYQYLCQKWDTMSKSELYAASIAAFFLLFPKYIGYRLRTVAEAEHHDVVLTVELLKDKVPAKYLTSYAIQDFDGGSLTTSDARYLKAIIREHPFSFYFNYKIMCRLASYSESISLYNPKIIISSAEYSFTSSVLTNYCEKRRVRHINVMHGEKRFNAGEAFSRFTVFYVWDEYYKQLFLSLRANKTEYVIHKLKVPCIKISTAENKCTYYLQMHTLKQLEKIKNILESTGMEYYVRPHPLYSNGKERMVFGSEHVENEDIDIWKSIAKAGMVISQDSTVLYQAYLVGARIVIDDVSDQDYYGYLMDSGYIMINKSHMLLSDVTTKSKM